MRRHYPLILALLVLSACGFHLRGSQKTVSTGLPGVFVKAVDADKLASEVKLQLQTAGTRVTKMAGDAEYVLKVENENFKRTILSISPDTGKIEEYQLTLTAGISVSGADAKLLLSGETISVTHDYTFDEEAVLGNVTQEEVFKNDLTQQAAVRIIRRLNAALKNR
ncbi:MAG: LPS assembly lipoprotein LptE [Gammaproteobacteria bacterium]